MFFFWLKLVVFILMNSLFLFFFAEFSSRFTSIIYPPISEQRKVQNENVLKNDFDLLILGNSRMHNDVDPEFLNIKSYNFAFHSESYDITYSKLLYLKDNDKLNFKYIILGTDYFQFSYTNDENLYTNQISNHNLKSQIDFPFEFKSINKLDSSSKSYINKKFTVPFYLLTRYYKLLLGKNARLANQKINGQLVVYESILGPQFISRDISKLENQVYYFGRILEFSKSHGIRVFIVIPPTTKEDLNNYSEKDINGFKEFINSYLIKYENTSFKDFSSTNGIDLNDFYDMSHLNDNGAKKFTKRLNEFITTDLEK